MIYDLKSIRSAGVTQAHLKRMFELPEVKRAKTDEGKRINRLIDLHSNRIDDGVRRALARSRAAYAIERAYDAPQQQISYTLVRDLIDRNASAAEVESMATNWGLKSMLAPWINADGVPLDVNGNKMTDKNAGRPGYKLNIPTFFNVFLPMVMAYTKIRWAKLFGDRDQHPLLKYEPLMSTSKGVALCRVITSRISRMSQEMGYREDIKQSILGMLLQSFSVQFPMESYYIENQVIGGKEKVVKEGVRWHRPHATKIFYDPAHPLHTINSDTGCEYIGYWSLQRWGEVQDNKNFWNKEGVSINSPGWRGDNLMSVYQEMYPCRMKFPSFGSSNTNDREEQAFRYSSSADRDAAIDVTVLFQKLIPADWGLGGYKHPIWMRFVYGGDRTVLYAEPMAYVPANVFLYDYDENRNTNSSLALELLPFQDQLSQLISQYLLTVRKNLISVVAVNNDVVDKDFFNRMSNGAENALRGIEFMRYSRKATARQQDDIRTAFEPLAMPKGSTVEILGAINTILGTLERVLGFSSQEVGGQASHQQSATETSIIAANTTVRMGFTASGVDAGIHAFKRAVYQAFVAYGSDEVIAQVADMYPAGRKALEDAGFKIEEGESKTLGVSGPKGALMVDAFSSERDGSNRINEPMAAQMMLTFVDRLMVPQFLQVIGVDAMMEMLKEVASGFGIPVDFIARMKAAKAEAGKNPEEQEQLVNAMRGIAQEELANFSDAVKTNIMEPLGQTQQQVAATSEAVAAVADAQQKDNAAIGQLAAAIDRLIAAAIPQPNAPIDGGLAPQGQQAMPMSPTIVG
jgi:hypothetical protein